MSGERKAGFTVIETMLFLAISGLLVIGILVGAGAAVNIQRYKDATHSLASYFQGEYDKVARVQNDRSLAVTCDTAMKTITPLGVGEVVRGTSDCVIVGRLVELEDTGKTIVSRPVYAAHDVTSAGGDTKALQDSGLFTADLEGTVNRYVPEWDTKVVRPKTSTADTWRLLIARSPASGSIHTYVVESNVTVADIVKEENKKDLTICLDPQGLVSFATRGVVIVRDASAAAGIKDTKDGQC